MNIICPDIEQDSPLWESFPDAEALAERALHVAGEKLSDKFRHGAELAILLSDDDHIRTVNKEWRDLDKPTNVLSFPAVTPEKIISSPFLGDLILAYETIRREADRDNKSFADHFTHLVIHGFLHLLGYDHETDADAELMESLETAILADLNIPDPYDETRFVRQSGALS